MIVPRDVTSENMSRVQTAHGTTTEPEGLGKRGARDLESVPCAVCVGMCEAPVDHFFS